jgi:hypothetical protein
MESMFNDSWGFVIIGAGMGLIRLVPTVLIFAAGVISVRKGFGYSGAAIIVSAVLDFLMTAVTGLGMFVGFGLSGEFHIWGIQGISSLSGFLLGGGVLGLVSSLTKREPSA